MLGFYTIEDVGCSYGLSISAKNKLDIVFLLGYPKLNKFVSLIYVSGKKKIKSLKSCCRKSKNVNQAIMQNWLTFKQFAIRKMYYTLYQYMNLCKSNFFSNCPSLKPINRNYDYFKNKERAANCVCGTCI